jgi:predicted dehydrogenase
MINMIHDVDLLQMLFGRIVRVYAEQASSMRDNEVEEGAAVTLRFENGVVGTFLALDNVPSPYNFEAGTGESAIFPFSGQDCYRVFGEAGSLSIPDNTLWKPEDAALGWRSKLKQTSIAPEVVDDAYERQLANFVAVVRNKEEPVCDGDSGLSAVAVCEAIRKSLHTQLPVTVENIEHT